MRTKTQKRHPIVNPVVFAKGIQIYYAWCELWQNSMSSFMKESGKKGTIRMRIVKKGSKMYLYVMDTGAGISKKDVAKMMDIGSSTKNTALNENGEGMKGCIMKHNPSDDDWAIYVRNEEEAFMIVPPLMEYDVVDIEKWKFGRFNFVVKMLVEHVEAQRFYCNITDEFMAFEFMTVDEKFRKRIKWELEKEFDDIGKTLVKIPVLHLDDNPYVQEVESFEEKAHIGMDVVSITGKMYKLCNEPDSTEKPTMSKNDLPTLDQDAIMFSIPHYTTQSYANLAGLKHNNHKGKLLCSQDTQGIYIYVNGRFNGRYDMKTMCDQKTGWHNRYNGCIAVINIDTNGVPFPSDANKRGFDFSQDYAYQYKAIIKDHVLPFFSACAKKKDEASLREAYDAGSHLVCRELNMILPEEAQSVYSEEHRLRLFPDSIRPDGVYINTKTGFVRVIREFKQLDFGPQEINQVFAYLTTYMNQMREKYGNDAILSGKVPVPVLSIVGKSITPEGHRMLQDQQKEKFLLFNQEIRYVFYEWDEAKTATESFY